MRSAAPWAPMARTALLHVSVATGTNAARHVAWREPGLIRGHISRFGNQGGTWNIAVDDWIAICRAAHGLWQAIAALASHPWSGLAPTPE